MLEEGSTTAAERGERFQQEVNRWVRAKWNFDAVADLDAAVHEASRPGRLKPEFDASDHIHINDVGKKAMADVFDLKVFKQ